MLVSFFQEHPYDVNCAVNLGVLLIEFFELCRKNFYHLKVGIDEGGFYFPKDQLPKDQVLVANGLYKLGLLHLSIKQSFKHAYHKLHMSMVRRTTPTTPTWPSLLGEIVQIPVENCAWSQVGMYFYSTSTLSWPLKKRE